MVTFDLTIFLKIDVMDINERLCKQMAAHFNCNPGVTAKVMAIDHRGRPEMNLETS